MYYGRSFGRESIIIIIIIIITTTTTTTNCNWIVTR